MKANYYIMILIGVTTIIMVIPMVLLFYRSYFSELGVVISFKPFHMEPSGPGRWTFYEAQIFIKTTNNQTVNYECSREVRSTTELTIGSRVKIYIKSDLCGYSQVYKIEEQ